MSLKQCPFIANCDPNNNFDQNGKCECDACISGYDLSQGGYACVLKPCPSSTYANSGSCVACPLPANCNVATCTSAADSTCTQCAARFYLAPNGVTVLCPSASVGDTGVVNGVTYTKRDQTGLVVLVGAVNEAELATSCTSGVTSMRQMFFVRVPPRYFFSVARPLDALTLTPRGHPPIAVL